MPPNTIYVGRPTKWGNPFQGSTEPDLDVNSYEHWIREQGGKSLLLHLHELRGKDLACWCPLEQPCHVDVLLELANNLDDKRGHQLDCIKMMGLNGGDPHE